MNTVILIGLLIGYGAGVWKFWSGFHRTNFSQGKIYLGLLWPVLLINGAYRKNFTKALKGQ
jgi:hypothetical protein